jgi:hypothetical protein
MTPIDYRRSPRARPPRKTDNRKPITTRIKNAGIAAMAHLTMNPTIDANGMLMSTTDTRAIWAVNNSGARAMGIDPGCGSI